MLWERCCVCPPRAQPQPESPSCLAQPHCQAQTTLTLHEGGACSHITWHVALRHWRAFATCRLQLSSLLAQIRSDQISNDTFNLTIPDDICAVWQRAWCSGIGGEAWRKEGSPSSCRDA